MDVDQGALDIINRKIAEAIQAERERCARIAEAEPELPGEPEQFVIDAMRDAGPIENARAAVRTTKRSIATAIRAGILTP
jgi:hypothetical protein